MCRFTTINIMNNIFLIEKAIKESAEIKLKILENQAVLSLIDIIAEEIASALKNGKKVLFCGNGGSAADAQHLAAELSGRFYFDREPLSAEALHVNTSFLTAVANDYSYSEVFSRLVKANGREGDVLVAISCSGNSLNILKAIETANNLKIITVGLAGQTGGKMRDACKYIIQVPSTDTPRIQESHILIGHIICEIIEKSMSKKP